MFRYKFLRHNFSIRIVLSVHQVMCSSRRNEMVQKNITSKANHEDVVQNYSVRSFLSCLITFIRLVHKTHNNERSKCRYLMRTKQKKKHIIKRTMFSLKYAEDPVEKGTFMTAH